MMNKYLKNRKEKKYWEINKENQAIRNIVNKRTYRG